MQFKLAIYLSNTANLESTNLSLNQMCALTVCVIKHYKIVTSKDATNRGGVDEAVSAPYAAWHYADQRKQVPCLSNLGYIPTKQQVGSSGE